MSHRSDVLLIKSLRLALQLSWDRAQATAELADAAAGDRRAVQHALARVRRAIAERPSTVGQRAADSLLDVLICHGGPAPLWPDHGTGTGEVTVPRGRGVLLMTAAPVAFATDDCRWQPRTAHQPHRPENRSGR